MGSSALVELSVDIYSLLTALHPNMRHKAPKSSACTQLVVGKELLQLCPASPWVCGPSLVQWASRA
jgi:hypothetical protein